MKKTTFLLSFLLFTFFTHQSFSQTTITFDASGFMDDQNLGSTETISGFVFTGSNGGTPQDLIVDMDGGVSGLSLIASNVDFLPGDLLTITKSGGGNFEGISFAYASNFAPSLIAEAFVGGMSQGIQTLSSPGVSGIFTFDATFDSVDEIRVTGGGDFGLFVSLDNFTFDDVVTLCAPVIGVSDFPGTASTVLDPFGPLPKSGTVDCWDFNITGFLGSGSLNHVAPGPPTRVVIFGQQTNTITVKSNDESEFDLESYVSQWFNFAGAYTITGYRDGVSVATSTGTASTSYTTTDLSGNNDFNNIDEFRLTGFSESDTTLSIDVITTTSATLGIEDFEETGATIKLFPNPSINSIQISGLTKRESYTIFNELGSVLIVGSISNNEDINIKNLQSGLYFLTFKNGETIKFIRK